MISRLMGPVAKNTSNTCSFFSHLTRNLLLTFVFLGCLGFAQSTSSKDRASFKNMTAEQLRSALKVVAGRSYAYYGFNNPEIQLVLPMILNSSYSMFEFPEPTLVNASGKKVAYKLERGLHNTETQIVEIRFTSDDGESPAQFARAKGNIKGIFPLKIETKKISPQTSDPRIRIKGDSVEVLKGTLPELPPFSELNPLRVFDKANKALLKKSTIATKNVGDQVWEVFQFDGTVARIEMDTISQAANVQIRYDIPIAKPLPESRRAQAPKDERKVKIDPKSNVDIQVSLVGSKPKKSDLGSETRVTAKKTKPDSQPKAVKKPGKQIAILQKSALSTNAGSIEEALEALIQVVPQPVSVVQLLIMDPTYVSISVDTGSDVKEWIWNKGAISGPTIVDTQWLQCKKGMSASAFNLARLPALYDDAISRSHAGNPLQVIVGQGPCGTAFVNIPFEGGTSVQYKGDGYFDKLQ